jgi:histidinol-phosphate aminotransferase
MALSRRAFVRTVGINGALAAMVGGRGSEALAGLVPGARQAPAAGSAGPPQIFLDSNENPYGPCAASLDAIRAAFGEACRYPDNFGNLSAALAKFHGVQPENILLGSGSSEILRMAVMAFTTAGRPLVQGLPTFESPTRDAELTGAPVVNVPVDTGLKLDLAGMAEKAGGAGLVFLCNPNNPTGTVLGADAVSGFVRRVLKASPTTIILVDEAYHDYVEDPAYRTALPVALENPQVVLARTFSKIYGLAGVRVGYAVGHTDTLKAMSRFRIPSNVNVFAAAAAIAALPQDAHVARQVALNREAREFTRRAFEAAGYRVTPPCANFLMVDVRRDAKAFQEACKEQGVLVGRPFPPLTNYSRISIGTLDEMRLAMDIIKRVLG